MEYTGKLYAKISNKYLETSHTYEFEKLEQEFRELKSDKIKVEVERDELLSVVQDLQHERNIAEAELTELKEKHKEDVVGFAEWILKQSDLNNLKMYEDSFVVFKQGTAFGKTLYAPEIYDYYNETHKTK
jgi:hypothetical protein